MINYIKSELYRNCKRKYFWGWTLVLALIGTIWFALIKVKIGADALNLMEFCEGTKNFLLLPVFLSAVIVDIVICDDWKNDTLKNTVSFGISKNQIILSKIIVSIIFCFILDLVLYLVGIIDVAVLFGLGKGFTNTVLFNSIKTICISAPILLGAICFGIFLAVISKKTGLFAFIYTISIMFGDKFVFLLKKLFCKKCFGTIWLDKITLTYQLNLINHKEVVLVGIAYIIIFTILSLLVMKIKDI